MPRSGIIGDIVHSVGVRYRVRGSGELRTRLWNLDQVRNQHLEIIDMVLPSAKERTIIANFQDQGVQIQFKTIFMDEYMNINKIICFVKPVAESYPIVSGG